MRVKDLIAELQACDPEAMVHGVCRVDQLPGYYDGPSHYEVVSGEDTVGYVVDRHHPKVVFHDVDLVSLFMDNPDLPVTFIAYDGTRYDLSAHQLPSEAQRYADEVIKRRKVAANIHVSVKSGIPFKDQVHCAECYALLNATQAAPPEAPAAPAHGEEG